MGNGKTPFPYSLLFKYIYAAYEAAALAFGGAVIVNHDVWAPTFRTYHNHLF